MSTCFLSSRFQAYWYGGQCQGYATLSLFRSDTRTWPRQVQRLARRSCLTLHVFLQTRELVCIQRDSADLIFRLPIPVISRLVLSNVLLCAALDAGKEWLLGPDTQVGVFWTLIRVLACAGLGVLVLEGFTGELGKRFSSRVEVRASALS